MGENVFAARFIVVGKDGAWINPAIAPLSILAALEPVDLAEAITFQPVISARL
jgi:hypothetical protein